MSQQFNSPELVLREFEKAKWQVDYNQLSAEALLCPQGRSLIMLCILAFDPSIDTVGIAFKAEARYSFKNKSQKFLACLGKKLAEQEIRMRWEKPRTLKLLWKVRKPFLLHQPHTTALRNLCNEQIYGGIRLILSCMQALKTCACDRKRRRQGHPRITAEHLTIFALAEPAGDHEIY